MLDRRNDIPEKFNEVDIIAANASRFEASSSGAAPPPYEIIIHPSSTCNLACDWCIGDHVPIVNHNEHGEIHISSAAKDEPKRLRNRLAKPDNMKSLIRDLLDFRTEFEGQDFRVERFSFSGLIGEPLVARKAIVEAGRLIADAGRTFGIFSNAVFLDEQSRLGLRTAEYFNFSLDASTSKTYALLKYKGSPGGEVLFHSAIRNVDAFRQVAPDTEINVSFILYPENFAEIYDCCRIAREIGARHFRVKQDISGNRSLSDSQRAVASELLQNAIADFSDETFTVVPIHDPDNEYLPQRSFSKCIITEVFAAIDSEGNVVPCNYHPRPGGHVFGNALDGGFRQVWQSDIRERVRAQLPSICPSVCDPFKMRANTLLSKMAAE